MTLFKYNQLYLTAIMKSIYSHFIYARTLLMIRSAQIELIFYVNIYVKNYLPVEPNPPFPLLVSEFSKISLIEINLLILSKII